MSALTQEERDGLEDVFLSIHAHRTKYHFSFKYFFKGSKYGLKKINISHLLLLFNKKKKHLRK